MEISEQPKLSFKGVNIVNVNFKSLAPRAKDININVECEPIILLNKKKKDVFSVIMNIKVASETYFELTLTAIGNFKLSTEIDKELSRKFLNINAPAIMFPYVRAFITTFTSNIGEVTGTLTIPPQFFSGDIQIRYLE